jgi:histidyl-tRNA synthetase
MASPHQPLPGFRDFAPREFLLRRYLFDICREVATRYGFTEYEAPILESTELYLKKSGGELSAQLFRFEDQGKRDVVLRPELTASLARVVAAQQRDYQKPLKWFELGPCFRYEKPQKGRFREFYQFNADLMGEPSAAADAELIALSIDTMRALGFSSDDFRVRLSDREVWQRFADENGVSEEALPNFLTIIDQLERADPEVSSRKLEALGVSLSTVQDYIANPENASSNLKEIMENLSLRGLSDYADFDLSIVRGLAYYTGVVFELFDARKSLRAIAGGGRYDNLVSAISGGKVDLPACGFAMGDAVIAEFIQECPQALLQQQAWLQRQGSCEVYLIIDDEEQRAEALTLATKIREAGISLDFPLTATKFQKQIKQASASLARYAVVIGPRFPEIKIKSLSGGSEELLPPNADVVARLQMMLDGPDGPLLT